MAALSPATSNHGTAPIPPFTAGTTTNASKNLRGLNKPKCIQCGNVARSRCPYQSCKSCCAKAQNPCSIHVLKSNATFTDKMTSPSSSDHQSNAASPSGNPHRFNSLRQLSNNFAQFNNLQSPLRSKKPFTRKEAATINEWRFLKLKEYKESNIQTENEAFERYMKNVSLLEEVLAVNYTENESTNNSSHQTEDANTDSAGNGHDLDLAGVKIMLRSNSARSESFRKRLGDTVQDGLRKLRKVDKKSVVGILNKQDEHFGKQEKYSGWAERTLVYNDLLDKLNKARNEEDLNACSEMAAQLFQTQLKTSGQMDTEDTKQQENAENEVPVQPVPVYSPPKWFRTVAVDRDDLNRINECFPWAEKIEML